MLTVKGKYNTARIMTNGEVDEATLEQVRTMCNLKSLQESNIVIMPDCHAGAGCTIGTTMTIHDAVIPNFVGVDIGCGVRAVQIAGDVDLEKLDRVIREKIPCGFAVHDEPDESDDSNDEDDYTSDLYMKAFTILLDTWCKEHVDTDRACRSLGTLGGGNHFIELDCDSYGHYWLVVHTGSRCLGKQVADYYQDLAYRTCNKHDFSVEIEKLKQEGRQREINDYIKRHKEAPVPKEYAHLSGRNMMLYLDDMTTCQEYAAANRKEICNIIIDAMGWQAITQIDTPHNYIDPRDVILRKGAVAARGNEFLVIPMNMRDGTLLCVGKENTAWNASAPHGAGRVMSRAKAKESISMETYEKSMEGIYSSSVCEGTKDEAPMAYKPAEIIKDAITNLEGGAVTIVDVLKPVYNFKASDKEESK
jgi:RNA-splicing ligase RtcB